MLPGQKLVGPDAEMVGALPVPLVETTAGEDVTAVPEELVTLTVYEPAFVTFMDCVVCPPGLHKNAVPEFAVSVTLPPGQKASGPFAEIVAVASNVFGMNL